MYTERGDDVTGIKRRRRDLSGDGIRNLTTALGRGRLKEDLESSTWRRRQDFKATWGDAGHEGAGGFADMYRNMSQGDCKFAKRVGWISKKSSGEGLTLGWGSRMNEPTGCMITLSANSNTCPLVTT
uniref:Uncharacterized protein n=1 Tax=Tanacetum cinerariifolium TaxID=118510 RepID=A0A6L2PAJ4_TANCI|nr:hypothetical protein [Tanacetum cinerariifolium]